MDAITDEARAARRAYMKEYRERLSREEKARRREYAKQWRKNNPDKVKAITARYWNKRAESMKTGESLRKENPEYDNGSN